jgi:hypothetical protein
MRALSLLLFVTACEAESQAAEYTLCDGSEEVRLSIGTGGGFVAEQELFTRETSPFLRVTGKCTFLVTPQEGRDWLTGTLSAEQAEALTQTLRLSELDALRYQSPENGCPDGPTSTISTADGFVSCTCSCGESAPAAATVALKEMTTAYDLTRAAGTPLRGPVEVIAVEREADLAVQPSAWPFAFPITEIAISLQQLTSADFARARSLEGADAEQARALRNATSTWQPASYYLAEGKLYALLVREQMPAAFDTE